MDSSVPIVVMGVAGSGKTTVGTELAGRLGRPFVDGDDLHAHEAVARMAEGIPLTDADREPWLGRVATALRDRGPAVVACSALRRRYRDRLREAGEVLYVFLDIDADEAERRVRHRPGHFLGAELVASQFAALEVPGPDEVDVVTVPVSDRGIDAVVDAVRAAVRDRSQRPDQSSSGATSRAK